MNLQSPISDIAKTKPQIAALKKLGILTARDLLFYFPYRYLDFSKTVKISELKPEENVTIKGVIKTISSRFSFRGRMSLAEAVISDDSGSIKITWFNQPYLSKSLIPGEEVFISGSPEYYNLKLQFTNPLYEKASDFPIHTARLVPVYHLTQSLYPKTLRNLIAGVLPLADEVADELPAQIVKSQNLLNIKETIKYSHFPEQLIQVEDAKKRLAFEEIFYNQLLAQQYKMRLSQKQNYLIKFDNKLIQNFVKGLPFELTAAQKKAAWDILQDLERPVPMNRLVEGDVGSGKTVVALMAALQTMSQGLQVVFLAPTEILAKQHFETIKKLLDQKQSGARNLISVLLTNSYSVMAAKDVSRAKLQKLISEGMPGIFVGTHALLQKNIKFKNLALVIIDEQHRFGVEQRAALVQNSKKVPHLLSLTATPIPRTLQLAYYGELDISQIKSKPAGRKPIATRLVAKADRPKAYKFINEEIKKGRQAFVITPLIEESDTLGVKSAKKEAEDLEKIFPQFKIGLLHGRMKSKDKENAMQDFLSGKTNILVATSVVEVGVDIPNASAMVIEGAERFGLAQLHQFRGRVGRAEHQSYCLLFTENEKPETVQRLQAFTKTQDGFALAELDLKQRGFGELYGAQQSGWNFKYFNPSYISLIEPARWEAKKILAEDLNLKNYPQLKEKIKGRIIHFE